jgi:hypothetical protein
VIEAPISLPRGEYLLFFRGWWRVSTARAVAEGMNLPKAIRVLTIRYSCHLRIEGHSEHFVMCSVEM